MHTGRLSRAAATATIVSTLIAVTACATRNPLEPAPTAHRVPGAGSGASTKVQGAKVVARVGAWTGSEGVLDDVTPVWVEIKNDTGKPLRMRYDDFALVTREGTRYSALPPFETDGTARLPVTYERGVYPRFIAAPYYYDPDPALAGYEAWDYYPDPGYYDYYYGYWSTVSLPTPEMLEQALPEGVVADGGQVAGFVYFERIDDDEKSAEFRYDLSNARTGQVFGVAAIPFRVVD